MALELTKLVYTFSTHRTAVVVTFKRGENLAALNRFEVFVDDEAYGYLPQNIEPSEDIARVIFTMGRPSKKA